MKEEQLDALFESIEWGEEVKDETREARIKRIRTLWESYKADDDVVSFEELAKLMENEPEVTKIHTPWESVNKFINGFRYEHLVILSAQEKSGKTTFALDMLESMEDQAPCCFLFEQSAQEVIRQRKERGQRIPIGYAPKKNIDNTLEWIEKRMMEAMVKYGSRVFLIDNVDWIHKEYGYNQRTDEAVKEMLLRLKGFCKQWEVIIILIAHVKKVPMDQIPQPDDIKDTAAFKQIADLVLILWRKTTEDKVEGTKTKAPRRTNETLLWVAENRQTGKTGYAQFVFDGKRFFEKEWEAGLAVTEQFNEYDRTF